MSDNNAYQKVKDFCGSLVMPSYLPDYLEHVVLDAVDNNNREVLEAVDEIAVQAVKEWQSLIDKIFWARIKLSDRAVASQQEEQKG